MIKRHKTLKIAGVIIALGAIAFTAFSVLGEGEKQASVSYLEGAAKKGDSTNGPWIDLAKGEGIPAGKVVKTEDTGRVELLLPDQSIVRIAPRSMFEIQESLFPSDKPRSFSAKLWLGSIWARVSKALSEDSKFSVGTKTAVAGVRGTVYSVSAADDSSSTFKVYDGQVAVTPPGEKTAKAEPAKAAPAEKREEMPFPEEITKEEWFELLLGRMQAVTVGPDGKPGKPTAFDPNKDKDDWAKWNLERDKKGGKK